MGCCTKQLDVKYGHVKWIPRVSTLLQDNKHELRRVIHESNVEISPSSPDFPLTYVSF